MNQEEFAQTIAEQYMLTIAELNARAAKLALQVKAQAEKIEELSKAKEEKKDV